MSSVLCDTARLRRVSGTLNWHLHLSHTLSSFSIRRRPFKAPTSLFCATRNCAPHSTMNRMSNTNPENVFTCLLCRNDVPITEEANLGTCKHRFCEVCMTSYLNVTTLNMGPFHLRCPGFQCTGVLNNWRCAEYLDSRGASGGEQLRRLGILRSMANLRHCSNPRCSTPFEYVASEAPTCTDVTCPLCKHTTCGKCNVKYHTGQTCEEASANSPFKELMIQEKWKHCPECRQLIERVDGCEHMMCYCGTEFCYLCGRKCTPECNC